MRSMRGIYEDGKVRLRGRPTVKGPVPVVVTFCDDSVEPASGAKLKSVADHPSFGMWAGRADIGDSASFSRSLREKAERRVNGR
jgi:hypothetical protein